LNNGRWVTTDVADSTHITISLWKEGPKGGNTESVFVDSVTVDATYVIDWDQADDIIGLRTINSANPSSEALPAHCHLITSNGDALTVATYSVPSNMYSWYGWRLLHLKAFFISADGAQVGFLGKGGTPRKAYLRVHSTTDFTFLWQLDCNWLYTPTYTDDSAGYIIGMPRADRVLMMWIDWWNSTNSSYPGRHRLRLYNTAGTILSTMDFWDPFYAPGGTPLEKWTMHPDGDATYVRTLPAQTL
jgi:hypothetical protein